MKVESVLVLFCLDYKDRLNPNVIWPLPKIDLEKECLESREGASSLLKEVADLEAFDGSRGWVVLHFNGVFDQKSLTKDTIYLVYSSVIPEPVVLKDGYKWRKMVDIGQDDKELELNKKILFTTGVKI